MSESPYVGVRQLGEQRDEGVHQVTVKYNAVLTLSHEHGHEVAELGVEPAAVRSGLCQWILATVLQRGGGRKQRADTLKTSCNYLKVRGESLRYWASLLS